VNALAKMTEERKKMVKRFLPRFLHGLGNNFAGIQGTETYQFFESGKYEYLHYVLQN
jgi:hypothetical protein